MIAIFRLNYEVVYKTFWKSLCDKVEILSRSFPRLVYSNLGFTRCQYFSGIVLSSQSAFYYSVTIFTPTPVVKQSHLHNYNTTVVPITRSKTKTKKKEMIKRQIWGLILLKQENVVDKQPWRFRWIIHRTRMERTRLDRL